MTSAAVTATEYEHHVHPCLDWLSTADARAAAGAELARPRLPATFVDDLVQDTAVRLSVSLANGATPERPVAYARRALRNAANDLHRSRRRREHVWIDELPEPEAVIDDPDLGPFEDHCRRVAALVDAGWIGSAALHLLTFTMHPGAAIPDDLARPVAGDDRAEAAWAALALAGRLDCFPGDDRPDDAATRQRRSRALAEVDAVLAQAVNVATGVER